MIIDHFSASEAVCHVPLVVEKKVASTWSLQATSLGHSKAIHLALFISVWNFGRFFEPKPLMKIHSSMLIELSSIQPTALNLPLSTILTDP